MVSSRGTIHQKIKVLPSGHTPSETADPLLARIKQIAEQHFDHAAGSHDWQHTLRVHGLCRRIGRLEGADMQTLEAAAFLHDIGRAEQDGSNGQICHAEKGAQMTEEILAPLPMNPSRKKKHHPVHPHPSIPR